MFASAQAVAAPPVVASYYMGKGDAKAATALPARKFTHLIYAFGIFCGDDPSFSRQERTARRKACRGHRANEVVLPHDRKAVAEISALEALKSRNPNLKILVSIGGWGMPLYPKMAASKQLRTRFVRSVSDLLRSHPQLDGIDIDWEYPGGGDNVRPLLQGREQEQERQSFRALAAGVRDALDRLGSARHRHYLLTAAVAGYPRSVAGVDWSSTQQSFDYLFVMTYDFTPEKGFELNGDYSGGGGPKGHHTNLHATPGTGGYGADSMIRELSNAGVPKSKMVIGAAFYGREWKRGKGADSGKTVFVGTPTYKELLARHLKREGFAYGYDDQADAAYYSGPNGFISFDDRRSICAKGAWAMKQGLAGIFSWEASQDDGTLIEAMREGVTGRCGHR